MIAAVPLGGRVTAVLLSYNHAHTIVRAVESVLRQTDDVDEIIVSDDCSTDDTLTILQDLERGHAKLKVIQPPRNLGMPGNANFAIAQAKTEYVALLHHDDVYVEDAFRQWKRVLDDFPDVAYVYNSHFDQSGKPGFVDPHESPRIDGSFFLFRYLLPRWACPVWGSAFIRKSAWEAVGGLKVRYGAIADIFFWMELASRFAVGYVAEPLFHILHDRPKDYPEDYVAFSWDRHRHLVDLHGDMRVALNKDGRLTRFELLVFRARATALTLKWILYAVVRRSERMLRTVDNGRSTYELPGLGLLRQAIRLALR